MGFPVPGSGGGGGLTNAYAHLTDGVNTADASGSDTISFTSPDGSILFTVVPGSPGTVQAKAVGGGGPTGPAGGDLAGTYPNPTLAVIGSATGPLGTASRTPTVTIDAKGRVTALTDQAISGAGIDTTAVHTSDYPITVAHGGTALTTLGGGGQGLMSNGTVLEYNYPLHSWQEHALKPSTVIAETASSRLFGLSGNVNLVSGTLYVVPIALAAGIVITSITFSHGVTGTTTPTHQIFGLYDNNKALLRATNDDGATAWAGSTNKTLNLTSTFTTTYTGQYWLACMVAAATAGALVANAALVSQLVGIGAAWSGNTSDTGLTTTLPNPFGTITQATTIGWGAAN